MRAAPPPRPAAAATAAAGAAAAPPPILFERSKTLQRIRQLIYFYLILLVFEGALRKWVVPQLSNELLIIRDPVVLAIYVLAFRAGCFKWNAYTISIVVIGLLCWVEGIIVLLPYFVPQVAVLVTGYGFRSDFLHLPLIFIIPEVFKLEDVKRVGWWTLLGLIPTGALMAWQFHASPGAFVNRVAGTGEGTQIFTSGGKIRPPATFSFVSGATYYLATAAAFLVHALISKLKYKTWLLVGASLALIVGTGVSGSRGTVLAVLIVVAMLAVILVVRPDAMTSVGQYVLIAAMLGWAVSFVPVFRQGVNVLSDRFTESAEIEERSIVGGLASRTMGGFTEGLSHLPEVPIAGYGLGVGTNGGARFLVGFGGFLLSENEWTRILLESGPILGLAFLIWRTVLSVHLGVLSFRALKAGNTLPILLFAAGVFAVINAPLGQPTSAGFTVILGGLCLAAARDTTELVKRRPSTARIPGPRPGRSAYAARLHDSSPPPSNGSVGR